MKCNRPPIHEGSKRKKTQQKGNMVGESCENELQSGQITDLQGAGTELDLDAHIRFFVPCAALTEGIPLNWRKSRMSSTYLDTVGRNVS